MIYLYAITEAEAPVPECRGLEDAELRVASALDVSALYSVHERIEPHPQRETLWRHEQVVEAAMEVAATLPVRFGTTFADDLALIRTLEREGPRLRQQLERVRGCVELAVRVGLVGERPVESVTGDGRHYLELKLARRRRAQALAHDTLAPLGTLAIRARHLEGNAENELVSASYLVGSDQVDRFSEEVTRIAERNPDLWLSCTGPWPPYSFADSEVAA